jgi:hypothetical protein
MIRKIWILFLLLLVPLFALSQCNQHVFSSVGASEWTDFEYQDCEGGEHSFGLPTGGYTIILCADIGTAFALNGDGFVYPLLTEHPSYPSCIQEECQGDFDGDGVVGAEDLLTFLLHYGICD